MIFPRYGQTNSQERAGVNAVAEAIAKAGLIWRETTMADVGIDEFDTILDVKQKENLASWLNI